MTAPISSDKLPAQLAAREQKADNKPSQQSAKQQAESNPTTTTETHVDRAAQRLVQESNGSESGRLQTPEDAKSALATLLAGLKNNPGQAFAAHAGVNSSGVDAALSAPPPA